MQDDWLAKGFEDNRAHLRSVAYRMLGSLHEADDAVQETWLRLSRSDRSRLENLRAWLTTVIGRICIDMLRSRKLRAEDPSAQPPEPAEPAPGFDPEQETQLADSVGLALLVVLDALDPAERLAFVMHDMFGMPFEEISAVLERTPEAARQLASRARRRVHGLGTIAPADLSRQRQVVEAFLAASRSGDFDALMAVLDPDVVVRADDLVIRGAHKVAKQALRGQQGQNSFARLALVNGSVGAVVAPQGRLATVVRFETAGQRVTTIEVFRGRERLADLEIAVLDG